MKKTHLYDMHIRLGGKIVDFGGWALPIQYSSILDEHAKVRNIAGLFDVSHMGEITVKGPEAEAFIQRLVTNDISKMDNLQTRYSPMCYPDGGVVDDILIYKFDAENYLLVVNAANTDKDFDWMIENLREKAEIKNVSDTIGLIAIQGPRAQAILKKTASQSFDFIKPYHFAQDIDITGIKALVSRTGYTGEDGFEIYVQAEDAPALWGKLMTVGKDEGMVPAGLGARDTLRLEAALSLYGHELSENISPLQAGLSRFVKMGKNSFIGKEALASQKEKGIGIKLVGFEMIDRGVPRNGYEVQIGGRKLGYVTSGGFSPTLGTNIGMALVGNESTEVGSEFDVMIREKPIKARVVKTPFYKKRI